ncbi:class III lanthionine synthetase LanKC [Streptomyces angustmyceticus]|uniref:Serine/threonine protein kinase n=1 Tax=Streptomyces angustmyceticus TaxID=285578 RepID=A0A5J4LNR2_9ACTN|nr:class III lanthionine synthetase LanKC [Streptomyces angustmyceticus]UAL66007.1 class III lanthionine synthetase LanKC [Streptomyces angustmyceticus]GES33661.1 serine/threonine protein kinase [Streptomyces angustmyceticus]
MEHFFYTFTDPDSYDDIARWKADPNDARFRAMRCGLVPVTHADGWQYSQHGIWTVCRPGGEPVTGQGWKIHVAVTPDTFETLVEKVSAFCFARSVPFKFLARYEYAWLINAKYAPRQGSGKGFALYPATEEQSVALAGELVGLLADTEGPRILSDLQIDRGVVHVRYGAYTRRHCRTDEGKVILALEHPDGHLVPDRRSVPFKAPSFVEIPDAFKPPVPTADGPVPPYLIDKTLHFSNSGGVYLATDRNTGRQMVLKEARPFAGYDLIGGDSVTRAVKEYHAMRTFSALPGIPAAYDQFSWQSHVFTAMEYVEGVTLQEWCAARVPFLVRPNPFDPPTPEDIRAYREDVSAIVGKVRGTLDAIWDRGYVFGDLHTGNVMVTPDLDVKLIDLEACLPQDAPRPFPGAPGFTDLTRTGRAADEYALCMLELSCYLPLTHLIRMDGAKLHQLVETCRTWYGLPQEWADRVRRVARPAGTAADGPVRIASSHLDDSLGFETWASQIVTGLRATMDQDRTDRLFRGDFTGFSLSPASLATGASGVLWSLLGTRGLDAPDLTEKVADWIAVRGRESAARLDCGLYDSELGAGYVLWKAGRHDHAQWLVETSLAKERRGSGLSIFSGLAGVFLATSEMSSGVDPLVPEGLPEELGAELTKQARAYLDQLKKTSQPDVSHFGLMHGVAGIGLAVHRYGLRTGDTAAVDLARELLEFELSGFVRCADGSLQFNDAGRRSLGYVEVGSCGAALVLAELTRHEGWTSAQASVLDLVRANGPELMVQSGLFRGRSGFVAGLATLARSELAEEQARAFVARHMQQLGLHEIRPREGELHFPGSRNFKLSSDLRTGSAGVLTGVAFASGRRDNWLPGVF